MTATADPPASVPASPRPRFADGYRPLDLGTAYNAGVDIFEDPHEVTLGQRTLHGLPFSFGDADAAVVRTNPGEQSDWTVGTRARWFVFAHAVWETDLFTGGGIGDAIADYTLHYDDGTDHTWTISQRFEIGPTPRKWEGRPLPLDWGQTPLLAVNDAQHELMDRVCGRYDEAGARLVDIEDPQSRVPYVLPYRFYLWPLRNPHPERGVERMTVTARDHTVLIGAITASDLDEEPFTRAVARPMLIELNNGDVDEHLSVAVDRGTTTYVYRTAPLIPDGAPGAPAAPTLPPGWGRPRPDAWPRGYARVSASRSARVRILRADAEIASFRWGDLVDSRRLSLDAATVWLPPGDAAWVRLTVRDTDGAPLPCRVRFQSPDGIPIAPYGHHAHINSDGGTWNLDIGGDVRLGADTSAFIDGTAEGWLPVGELDVEVSRGFEYAPVRRRLRIEPDQDRIDITLHREFDARARGYASGDTHVHFVSSQGAELEARAEDVDVTNLLLTQWGHLYTSTEEFVGRPQYSADGETVVFAGQENRTNMLGHINLLGLRAPIMPWCTGGSEEAELGGGLETTLSHWADECRAQGGVVVLAHFPVPYGETAALLATGRLDAVETIAYDEYTIGEYYRYLNAGYRIPLVAGTDKMTSEVPIGLMRTYAGVEGEGIDYWAWCDGIRRGDTVASSGPLLWLDVDGARPGAVLTDRAAECTAHVVLESVFPVDIIEIVQDGVVVHREPVPAAGRTHEFRVTLPVTGSSWLAARCAGSGDGMLRHCDTWSRPVFAHTSPVYVSSDPAYEKDDETVVRMMLASITAARRYVVERARIDWPGTVRHRHGEHDHLAYLTRPFDEATAALASRAGARREDTP